MILDLLQGGVWHFGQEYPRLYRPKVSVGCMKGGGYEGARYLGYCLGLGSLGVYHLERVPWRG